MKTISSLCLFLTFVLFANCAQKSDSNKGSGKNSNSYIEQLLSINHNPNSCISIKYGRYYPDISKLVFNDLIDIDKSGNSSTLIRITVESQYLNAYTDGVARCNVYKNNDEICAVAGCEGQSLVLSLNGSVNGHNVKKKYYLSQTGSDEIGFADVTDINAQSSKRLFRQ